MVVKATPVTILGVSIGGAPIYGGMAFRAGGT
jgi:hypothetical protein